MVLQLTETVPQFEAIKFIEVDEQGNRTYYMPCSMCDKPTEVSRETYTNSEWEFDFCDECKDDLNELCF